MGRVSKWLSDKASDAVFGKQERINHELTTGAEQLLKDNAPNNPQNPKDGKK
ncbi:hypothetical protein [Kibdelosporangium phytohabitans]|uniref:hypothetical protein n=1 Tax=Kibdelosporangium phytohabitans TaxID=860235 RepID=UPI0012FCD845|nr:hypothetical protein [Kibdelosporangium phytohabitans]MBE1471418.1 hypothetical protein [Kibdelosporangium phytohabitans]